MTGMSYWLPLVWAAILIIAVAAYVILDGFDLGIGILFPFAETEEQRDIMMNSVAPFWDGNETWLVMGGVGVLVAFPLAYAIIMPALYLPIIIMLLALVFRGVAFEYRWVAKPKHAMWDLAFAGGSTLATFMQGVVLGGILQGIKVEGTAFAGSDLDWLRPFPIFVGLALIAGYALLGATFLLFRTEGEVAERSRAQAKVLLILVLVAMVIVSLWTPFASEHAADRWFSWPNILYLSPVPILTALAAYICWRSLQTGREVAPFVATIVLFLLGFTGLIISNMPYLVPTSITLWQAAAPPESQVFILIGTLILLPLVLGYTAFNYWTFRGKVQPGEGYH